MTQHQIFIVGRSMAVKKVTTRCKGSWKYQDAFGISEYVPKLNRRGAYFWRSVRYERNKKEKFAATRATAGLFLSYGQGSLHNRPARVGGVDDFGNLFFVA